MRPFLVNLIATTALLAGCGQDASEPSMSGPAEPAVEPLSAASAGFGTITIVLDMQPNRTVDIPFTTAGKKLTAFVLDDDSDPTRSSSRTFQKLKPGTYAVQQTPVTGVTPVGITCESTPNGGSGTDNNTIDLGNRRVTVQLERNETAVCTFAASMPIWAQGDFLTYPQGDWGGEDDPEPKAAAALLHLRWNQVYASTFGVLEVGIPGTAGFSIIFDNADGALAYLPALGPVGILTSDAVNPPLTAAGTFGGEVVALEFNTDFSAAGLLTGGTSFGNLSLCGVTGISNTTVNAFLAAANQVLAGGSSELSFADVVLVTQRLNVSFIGGSPSAFAQDHLVSGACP